MSKEIIKADTKYCPVCDAEVIFAKMQQQYFLKTFVCSKCNAKLSFDKKAWKKAWLKLLLPGLAIVVLDSLTAKWAPDWLFVFLVILTATAIVFLRKQFVKDIDDIGIAVVDR